MATFLLVTGLVLIVLSLVASVMIHRKLENHPFVVGVQFADILFLFFGMFIVGLANVSLTNQFAKYEEGFPHVDMGGLPEEVFVINMLFFLSPLIAIGLFRIIKEAFRDFSRVLFSEMPSNR